MRNYPATVVKRVRKLLTRGLLVLLPLALTLMVVRFAIKLSDSLVGSFATALADRFPPDSLIGKLVERAPGLSFAFLLAMFLIVGAAASTAAGKKCVAFVDGVFQRIPLVRAVYASTRRTVDLFDSSNGKTTARFSRVVLVEQYPKMLVPAFVSAETVDSNTGEKHLVVVIPGKPNPTGVAVMIVKETDVIDPQWKPDEGLRWGMSLGMLTPPQMPLSKK